MPADIVERLNAEVNQALELAEVRERLKPEGIVPSRMSATEFGAFVAEELALGPGGSRLRRQND